MRRKVVVFLFVFSWLMVGRLMADTTCSLPDSVVPPRWCDYPEGMVNPTSPQREQGTTSGKYELHIDDRILTFFSPLNPENEWPSYVPVLSTRSREAIDWLRVRGEYNVNIVGLGWNFYPLGLPLFGSSAQFSILAKKQRGQVLHYRISPC